MTSAHPESGQAYEDIADWFDRHRTRTLMEQPYLDLLLQHLERGAAILDLGCGTGEPILRYLLERSCAVTGVDASAAMLAIAGKRFPGTPFVHADMRSLPFGRGFDAIVAWHSLFHLPHDGQRAMFARFARHLHPCGILMFTSGSAQGETWSDNGGALLYHASLNSAEYRGLLEANGFRVLRHTQDDAACGGATVWIAQYRPGESDETAPRL
ncbi:class I SAM-dependent methyltransferase [Massilia sp. Leaf139]|uniref:class I SAM-dependent DNA methyltransferase n=1 Tax=Massilia sp. Leaf139 TaxID=1736272 RepID=UPI0006FD1CD2|nr:class I SAM-dependent methyltransferase [Massilia sp. Leaf139]KQQ91921.1 hypothetical protein ASF77_08325 [Massilia sp. Leaf139]